MKTHNELSMHKLPFEFQLIHCY